MADVAISGSRTTSPAPNSAHHGRKRAAENSIEHEHRLSKRFDLLNLVDTNGSRLYIPVPGSSDVALSRSPSHPVATADPLVFVRNPKAKRRLATGTRIPSPSDDAMQVEDTPHRVYIHDLSAELSDIESDEDTPIFLPDIEKHLSKIPKHVLVGPDPKPNENNQVVLYNVPSSLSVPQERDGVRKAIVEARQRIRQAQVNPLGEPVNSSTSITSNTSSPTSVSNLRNHFDGTTPQIPSPSIPSTMIDNGADAMDLD